MTAPYKTGTISLVNGSTAVVGILTAWATALITGGTIYVQAAGGNPMPIDTVVDDTHITASLEWTGATGTYSYAIMRDTSYGSQQVANADALAELIAGLRAGTIFKYDVSGDLAGKATYDERPKGFGYLVTVGVDAPELYVKASAASADWSGPFAYGTGPMGPAPNIAIGTVTGLPTGDDATASVTGSNPNYHLNLGLPAGEQGDKGWTIQPEIVADGLRSVIRVASFVGGAGATPGGVGYYVGATGLVASIADAADVRGSEGAQGPRGVTWRGTWSSAGDYAVSDLVSADDAGGETAIWIAIAVNTNAAPKDNPADWQFFPGSFPTNLNYGLWSDPVSETINYGSWA